MSVPSSLLGSVAWIQHSNQSQNIDPHSPTGTRADEDVKETVMGWGRALVARARRTMGEARLEAQFKHLIDAF